MSHRTLRIGLILNPIAGIGGPAGLKGSDNVVEEAMLRGSSSHVAERVTLCLEAMHTEDINWVTLPGPMGADVLAALDLVHEVLGDQLPENTTAEHTRAGVQLMCGEPGLDLLLFAGGDGTARDVVDTFDRIHGPPAVLGIPCGVKMHSGVFATSPGAAAELVNHLLDGEILSVIDREVRDIDEASFREGIVKTRYYGELPVPDDLRYVQQTKIGGREVEALVVQDIAAEFQENMLQDVLYIMGSGSTVGMLMESIGLEGTLLGIDVVLNGELLAADVSEQQLLEILDRYPDFSARILVTAIGGQGHILGRGNQQLSAEVIRRVGVNNIDILATKSKLAELENRPLLVDTGDPLLDKALGGMKQVITGYEDRVLYRVA